MAGQDRTTSPHLITALLARAPRFSFYQLVFLLERLYRPEASVGAQGPAKDEVLRFRPDLSFAFPVSDIATLEQTRKQPPRFRLTTTFLGLYGTTSPLPPFYTEDLMTREDGENPVRAFLDLFHHRLLSLLYRAWGKYRYQVQFEPSGNDRFSERMFAFLGLGVEEVTRQTGLPSSRLLRYAGLMSQRPRSASALEGLLSDFFDDINVHIDQCTGRWIPIPREQQSILGLSSCVLGEHCVLGETIFGRQSSFRISMGPMRHDTFLTLLPGSSGIKILSALVQLFVQDRFDVDVELILDGAEVPVLRLTSTGEGPRCRLGQNTWLPLGSGDQSSRHVRFRLGPTGVPTMQH